MLMRLDYLLKYGNNLNFVFFFQLIFYNSAPSNAFMVVKNEQELVRCVEHGNIGNNGGNSTSSEFLDNAMYVSQSGSL